MSSKAIWPKVSRQHPCPVCGRPDWCLISPDGTEAICPRVEEGAIRKVGEAGWLHRLEGYVPPPPPPKPKRPPVATESFAGLAEQCHCALMDAPNGIEELSEDLGLSVESLHRLRVGWSAEHRGYTFPMKDGRGRVIGIRIRAQRGKWCVPGSRNGLFWPEGVSAKGPGPLLLPEGPTSCAACLDLGYDAIGRPNCELGAQDLSTVLKQAWRDVVIVADHDEPHYHPDGSVYYPGQYGAEKIAPQIKPFCRTLKIVKPPGCKDMRDWFHAGATRPVVDCVIKSQRFV